MKKRFKKTKRETLSLLIIKTVVIASLICGAFAFIRWNMMCNVVSYQLTDKTVSVMKQTELTAEKEMVIHYRNYLMK